MGVDPLQLGRVEGGGSGVEAGTVEEFDELFLGEDLLVAVGPAQTHQIVDQSLGQQAVVLVFDDGAGSVTLGELLAVGA